MAVAMTENEQKRHGIVVITFHWSMMVLWMMWFDGYHHFFLGHVTSVPWIGLWGMLLMF